MPLMNHLSFRRTIPLIDQSSLAKCRGGHQSAQMPQRQSFQPVVAH